MVVDPIERALAKIRFNPSGPPARLLDLISVHLHSVLPRSTISGPSDLSTALNGIAGVVKRLDLTTSAGGRFESNVWKPYDKSEFVTVEQGDNICPNDRLEDQVRRYLDSPTRRPDVASCTKDERLPLNKAQNCLTRLFCIFPFPFLVYSRLWTVLLLDYFARHPLS